MENRESGAQRGTNQVKSSEMKEENEDSFQFPRRLTSNEREGVESRIAKNRPK